MSLLRAVLKVPSRSIYISQAALGPKKKKGGKGGGGGKNVKVDPRKASQVKFSFIRKI